MEPGEDRARNTAFPYGTVILEGQYRLLQLLYQRPRVNLYLGQRLSQAESTVQQANEHETLVTIRELVLSDLGPAPRAVIKQAAFEEFVSPLVLGSPHLPGAGDRVRVEGDRLYLVMQLRQTRGEQPALAVTLAELLLSRKQWPLWLDMETALGWGIELCRIVARLHRSGVVLGDLNPATVLVDKEGAAAWAPVLLVSWPPAPQFWPQPALPLTIAEQYVQIFPIDMAYGGNAFVAPETLAGSCDERSDVYALGAILYLLFTRYAPVCAAQRQARTAVPSSEKNTQSNVAPLESMELIAPRLFNNLIPPSLEYVVLRALALEPWKRYASVPVLLELLEAYDLKKELAATLAAAHSSRRKSSVGKAIAWLRRELNS